MINLIWGLRKDFLAMSKLVLYLWTASCRMY